MRKSMMAMLAVTLVGFCVPAFAGLVWQSEIMTVSNDDTSFTKSVVYAQSNQVRQEYTEITGKTKNAMTEKGYWWLYKGASKIIYIVNPEDKTYFGMNFDSLMSLMGSLGSLLSMKITNAASSVQELGPEQLMGYDCKHIMITSAYDMEMKVLMMKVKSHVERKNEVWATGQLPTEEIAMSFWEGGFKTGMAGLDSLIAKEMEMYKGIGVMLKSVAKTVTTDAKGKTTESTTTSTVTGLEQKQLDDALFELPADYKEVNLNKMPGGD